VALAPLKAVKRGAQSTPGSARPASPPPPGYEEAGCHQGRDTGASKPQGPEDADLGGAARPTCAEEGRAIVVSSVAPEASAAGREEETGWGKSPVIWPNLGDAKGGPDLSWTTRQRVTSGRVWMCVGAPGSRPLTELPSSWVATCLIWLR